ncbi:MAG: hypothetical protein U1F98_07500 [Verrucomicrobiota bacterium]
MNRIALFLLLLCGCAARTPAPSSHHRAAPASWGLVTLAKPIDPDAPGAGMAPFIFQQAAAGGPIRILGQISPVGQNPEADLSRSVVYWSKDFLNIRGRLHARYTYEWCSAGPVRVAGVRVVLDSAGLPVIWELLPATSGEAASFYMSSGLEMAAAREYPAPTDGRRFAVETANREVEVADLVADAPMPMGPMICQDPQGNVLQLQSRCMPIPPAQLISENYYEWQPLAAETKRKLDALQAAAGATPGFYTDSSDAGSLEQILNLPKDF